MNDRLLNMVRLSLLFVGIFLTPIVCTINVDKEAGTYYLVKLPGWLLKQLIEEKKDEVEVVELENDASTEKQLESSSEGDSAENDVGDIKPKGTSHNSIAKLEDEERIDSRSQNPPQKQTDSTNKSQIREDEKISQASLRRESEQNAEKSDYDDRDDESKGNTDSQPRNTEESKDVFFSYSHVYAPNVFEFGYRRGNEGHFTERREARKGPSSRIALKWGDSKSGYGEQYWDLNHGSKQEKKTS